MINNYFYYLTRGGTTVKIWTFFTIKLNLNRLIETENSELSDDSSECICKTGFALDEGKCVEAPISITDLSCIHYGIQCGKVQNHVTMKKPDFNSQAVGIFREF